MTRIRRAMGLGVTLTAVSLVGCGGDAPATPPPTTPTAGAGAAAARTAAGGNGGQGVPPPPMTITDTTFVESPQVRDPFRSYAREFISNPATSIVETRDVKLRNFSLEDLRLVAVVVGSDLPYAMVVDPTHAGTILRRGMLVGRSEMIHNAANPLQPDYITHWRVARITAARLRRSAEGTFEEIPAELVFERPDPLNANAPIVERTLALAPTQGNGSQTETTSAAPSAVNPMLLGPSGGGSPYLPPNLSALGGGAQGAGIPQSLQGGTQQQTTTTVYNVTQPAAAPSPTVVVQQPPPAPGSSFTSVPPVQINGSYGSGPLPSSGLAPSP